MKQSVELKRLDQGMPRSAVAHLRDSGWDAVHADDIGLSQVSDQIIPDRARHDGCIVITLDADFHRGWLQGSEK